MLNEDRIENFFEKLTFKQITFIWFFVLFFFLFLHLSFTIPSSFVAFLFLFVFCFLALIFTAHSSYLMARERRSLWSFVGYGFVFSFLLCLAGFLVILILSKYQPVEEDVAPVFLWFMAFYYIGTTIFVLSLALLEFLGGILWKIFLFENKLKEIHKKEQKRLSPCINIKTISAFILSLAVLSSLYLVFYKLPFYNNRSMEYVLKYVADDLFKFSPIIVTLSFFPVFYLVHRRGHPFLKFAGQSIALPVIFIIILYILYGPFFL
mgnify:CR=1 FL=1